jgi:NAD(P)-dependent dehydrogenase (short-subunit alcohol dehydrogenase family)
VVKAIELGGGKAIAIHADAADAKTVKGAVEKAVATFGRLDVTVNNAGTAIPKTFKEVKRSSTRPWQQLAATLLVFRETLQNWPTLIAFTKP